MSLTPELAEWRKAQRQRLLEIRQAATPEDRARWSAAIEATLFAAFRFEYPWVVAFCWPFQAEFDARPYAARLHSIGVRLAVPVVVAKGQPLEFLQWVPGDTMEAGAYGIPIPTKHFPIRPDVLLVPPVGIGRAGDRLGYGGGFFDRTLAALNPRPITIAHAFELSRVPTTYPQAHDILMDFVVTESGIESATPSGGLKAISTDECQRLSIDLARQRLLPIGKTTS